MNMVYPVLGIGLLILSFMDIRRREIPVVLVVFLGLFSVGIRLWENTGWMEMVSGLLPGLLLIGISLVSRGSIGIGDGMVVCVLGVACGLLETVALLGTALLTSGTVAAVLLLCKRAGRKTEMPFLPFLLVGYIWSLLQK